MTAITDCVVSSSWRQSCFSSSLTPGRQETLFGVQTSFFSSNSRLRNSYGQSSEVPCHSIAFQSSLQRHKGMSRQKALQKQLLRRSVVASVSMVREAQAGEGASMSRRVARFWEWVKQNGAVEEKAAFQVAEVPEGLGLQATGQIGDREELFSVPESMHLSLKAARESAVGNQLEDLPSWVALALFLLHEKAKPTSQWRPYLDLLPEELDSPFFWEDEDLKELEGTQLLGSVLGYRGFIEETFEETVRPIVEQNPQLWPPSVATPEAFAWAFGIVRSRTHEPFTGDDIALVPLADLVNHGNGPYSFGGDKPFWQKKTVGFFNAQKPVAVMQPRRSYRAGQQITMDYGQGKANSDLALDYGFVVEGGIGEGTRDRFQLTLEIPEEDRFVDDKLDIAELNGLGQVCQFGLERGLEPATQLLAFLRLIAMNGADAFLLESIFRDAVWEHMCLPLSRDNEEGICVSMIEGIRASLANYETSIEEDVRLLGSLDGDDRTVQRKRLAVTTRLAEKRILSENLDYFENRVQNLDGIEYYAERRLKGLGLLDDSGDVTPWDELGL